ASQDELRLVLEYWQSYWFVHRDMHRELSSQSRLGAIVTETRYAKWVGGALTGRLPTSQTGIARSRTSLDELAETLPVTLSLVALAALLTGLIAIPLGVIGAYRRGRPIDVVLAFVLMAFHSLPPFALAELFDTWLPRTSIVLPAFALALGTIGVLSRTQRSALLEVLSSDYVRTARAKGAFGARLLIVHALRTALVPMVALAGLQIPVLFGGAVLVEDIFELPGTGRAVLDAIRQGDTGFVVVCVLVLSLLTSLSLVAADLAAGVLDPRIRETLRRRGAT
ncbi:MAG: ABC transporter permease, partial [Proteobacteria bacterium]